MAEASNNKLFNRVVALLAPHLGETTALASVKLYLKKMNLTPNMLSPEHLETLAEKIKPGLVVFVGNDQAQALADQVKQLHLTMP